MSLSMAGSSQITQALRKSYAMGPSVRNLLTHYRLDPNQIASTGPHRILLKSDVLNYISQKNLAPQNASTTPNLQTSARQATTMVSTVNIRPSVSEISHTTIREKYPRRQLDPIEIEVINSGGIIETASPENKLRK